MHRSRVMTSTIAIVLVALGVLAMPVGASHPAPVANSVKVASNAAAGASAASTSATHATNTMKDIPVSGSANNGDVFHGHMVVKNFVTDQNRIMAVARLTGRVVRPDGSIVGRITDYKVRMPVRLSDGTNVNSTAASPSALGTCDILHLRLGAIDLNVLGLVVHLDPVRLDITAQAGPGNLLGNLLCAVTGLLDNTGVNDVLVSLLRAIRQILNGL